MNRLPLPIALALALAAAGCGEPRPDDVPVVASAIGGEAEAANPSREPLEFPEAVFLYATAQGLVRFDSNGQIVAGLAERWIVIDEGRSFIFRLRDAEWPDGSEVTAQQVVRALRRATASNSRNPLAPYLEVVDEIVEMTPRVIEVRLRRSRPDLLQLFAQPEMAIVRPQTLGGTGPFRVEEDEQSGVLLRPAIDSERIAEEGYEGPGPAEFVQLHGERAALALARFAARKSDLVLGGTFVDWPLVGAAGIAPANIRFDPALGLFGLAVVEQDGFLAEPENRAAVAMAIDRDAIVQRVLPERTPVTTLLPEQLDSSAAPAVPQWAALTLEERRARARARVSVWRQEAEVDSVRLRVALPEGPGATMLWAHLAADLRSIGIEGERVAMRADADLRLIDAVAPYDSARWFLVTACRLCSEDAELAAEAARDAPTLQNRAQRIAEADALLSAEHIFIPIAQPLRWSIVALRLDAWQRNSRAWHPLDQLRNDSE